MQSLLKWQMDLGCHAMLLISLLLLTFLANGLAQPEVCAGFEFEEYPSAGFGLQNIDRPNGSVVREELRPIE